MKPIALILSFVLLFLSCNNDDDDTTDVFTEVAVTLTFSHFWDETQVNNTYFNTIQYTNAHGEQLSIERLRYLISDLTFTTANGQSITLDDYALIDVTNNKLSFSLSENIPTGTYSNVSFTFGFKNEKNSNGTYPDLNSASWNVPDMLGGGYHYMQLDGKYLDNTSAEQGYNYHAIRAVDATGTSPIFPSDTFITVNLGEVTITNAIVFNVEMNIAEWFKNPNIWDLNTLNTVLMPNSEAQIMMHENGQNVFSLGSISQ